MKLIVVVALAISITMIVYSGIILIKNNVTFDMHDKLLDAIRDYKFDCIDRGDFDAAHLVEFRDLEPYSKTLYRIWDWGYENILPPEKFELIKPFLTGKEKV